MYDDRKEKFSFKSFFLTLLIVLLFVFLMLWIFPTRWDLNKLQSTYDLERLTVLYDEIFANNVARMKDAAIGYFTNERMPQKVGESKKLTLQQMYDLHLVLKMKDKDGKECNVDRSYVEMTKYTDEYQLKVNLSCGGYEDYIIVYLGCYDYCSGKICEKQVVTTPVGKQEETTKPTPDEPTPDKPTPDEPTPDKPTPDKPTPIKKYMYEYMYKTEDCITCTKWSNWQKDVVKSTDKIKVETKVEKEIKSYKTVTVQTGTKTEIVVKKVNEKYISGYSTKLVVVDTKKVPTGQTTTQQVTEKVAVGTVDKFQGIGSGTKVPSNTSTTKYKVVSTDKPDSCSNCENETYYTWEIYKVETVYDVITTTVTVPVYKTVNVYEQQQVPIYDFRVVEKEEKVTTPVYEQKKVPEYHNVTYYRYQTCTTKKGTTDIKWSYNKFDTALIGKGYKLTGNVKEV